MIELFYRAALIEGEGYGTAYEYQVKANLLRAHWEGAQNVLILGLPEKFGVSANFLIQADQTAKPVLLVDDNPALIAQFHQIKKILQEQQILQKTDSIISRKVPKLTDFEPEQKYDLIIIQKLTSLMNEEYFKKLLKHGGTIFLFAPNANNFSHQKFSKLTGVDQAELSKIAGAIPHQSGFIDCPPFPSGVKIQRKSSAQETQKLSPWSQALDTIFLSCLNLLCNLEPRFPHRIKEKYSHIIYLTLERQS